MEEGGIKMKRTKEYIVSVSIAFSFLIAYLAWLVYFLYFSKSFELFREAIKGIGGLSLYFFLLVSTLLGIYLISVGYYKIINFLFFPISKEERRIKSMIKEVKKKCDKDQKASRNLIDLIKLDYRKKQLIKEKKKNDN